MENCKYCLTFGTDLISPCFCKGTIQFVHKECLINWLKETGKKKCEICGKKYKHYIGSDTELLIPIQIILLLGLAFIFIYFYIINE